MQVALAWPSGIMGNTLPVSAAVMPSEAGACFQRSATRFPARSVILQSP